MEGHSWILDFERTGWGPILQDFAELETDIITRLTECPGNLDQFFRLCVALVAPENPKASLAQHIDRFMPLPPSLDGAAKAIIHLRRLAETQTRYLDSREYLWGILLNTIYVMSLNPDPERLDRALILGGVVCERLGRGRTTVRRPRGRPHNGLRY